MIKRLKIKIWNNENNTWQRHIVIKQEKKGGNIAPQIEPPDSGIVL